MASFTRTRPTWGSLAKVPAAVAGARSRRKPRLPAPACAPRLARGVCLLPPVLWAQNRCRALLQTRKAPHRAGLLQCLIERGGYTLLDVRPELELDVVSRRVPSLAPVLCRVVPARVCCCLADSFAWTLRAARLQPPAHADRLGAGADGGPLPRPCQLGANLHISRRLPQRPPPPAEPRAARAGRATSAPAGGPRARVHQHPAAALPLGLQLGGAQQGGGAPAQQELRGRGAGAGRAARQGRRRPRLQAAGAQLCARLTVARPRHAWPAALG